MDAEGSRKDFRVRCSFHVQGELFMFGQIGIFVVALLAIFMMRFGFPIFARGRDNKDRRLRPLGGAELLFNDGCAAYSKKRYRDAIRMFNHAARIRPESSM